MIDNNRIAHVPRFESRKFHEAEVVEALMALNPKKSMGQDLMPLKVFWYPVNPWRSYWPVSLLRAINKAILFLRLVEWKIAVDRKKIVTVLSTDLSRALDSQTYPILLCKLITIV